jgi:hypothetical protein
VERVHEPMDRERRWSTVDHGHRPGEGSPENGQRRRHSVESALWTRKQAIEGEVSVMIAGGVLLVLL